VSRSPASPAPQASSAARSRGSSVATSMGRGEALHADHAGSPAFDERAIAEATARHASVRDRARTRERLGARARQVTFAASLGAVTEGDPGPQSEKERSGDDEADEEGGHRAPRQLMVKLLLTENGLPEKAGTCAPRKRAATQAPVGVPAKGGPETTAEATLPPGANVTTTRPDPLASPFLQAWTLPAMDASRAFASPMLKGWSEAAATAGASFGAS
jgi:hypothetical protein